MVRCAVLAIGLAGLASACNSAFFDRTDLVSDLEGAAPNTDPALVNPWGILVDSRGTVWVANAGTGTITGYHSDGRPAGLAPIVVGQPITGIVVNPIDGLELFTSDDAAPAELVAATHNGALVGFSEQLSTLTALAFVDNGAGYTGLALSAAGDARLFAADFAHRAVVAFDDRFRTMGIMVDPDLPKGYAPFGIQRLGNQIFVTYVLVGDTGDAVKGDGLGIVSSFFLDGSFHRRVVTGGSLNAPWGLARAPNSFGEFSGALLVGNFGDGRIIAIDDDYRTELGVLETAQGTPFQVDGLWGLAFRGDALFFTAGIADETHGLVGRLDEAD